MYQGIRPLVTTGVAIVGASVIAVSPLTAPPPAIQAAPLPAAQPVVEMSDVQLTGLAEDLERFVNAVRVAPTVSWSNTGAVLDQLGDGVRDAESLLEAVKALAFALSNAPSDVLDPFIVPLTVNTPGLGSVPGDITDWDFGDAVLLTLASLAREPLNLVELAPTIVYLLAVGNPANAVAFQVAQPYLTSPLGYALPFVIALANALPPALGGGVNPTAPEDSGTLLRAFVESYIAYNGFLEDIFTPQQMIQGKQGIAKALPEDTWPPSAERVGEALRLVADEVVELPGNVVEEVVRAVRTASRYLAEGRPLDAVRLLAARTVIAPFGLAEDLVWAAEVLSPPPFGGRPGPGNEDGGLIHRADEWAGGIAVDIADRLEPDPLESVVDYKGIESFKQQRNFVNLSLPENKKVDEITNVGLNKDTDPDNGNQVTKIDSNHPKVGSNVRAVVKEVRKEIRETVKDVRQGVRDVVKAVTGLGKKKEVKKEETSTPAE